MFREAAKKLLALTILLAITGGQWMVLQSAAWAGMFLTNLRHDSLSTALTQTFDGQHPCPMCKAIEHGKSREKKSETESKLSHIELTRAECLCGIFPDNAYRFSIRPANEFAESAVSSPLLRPPC